MFDIFPPWIATPLGFVMLWLGAEALVRGASRIASSMGISQVVIGLTLVAFGTSLPELLVCVNAAISHTPDFAIGNIVGSNIANIGLIAGFAAVLAPLTVAGPLLRRDLPFALLAALAVGAFGITLVLGRIAGVVMLVIFSGYMVILYRGARKPDPNQEEEEREYLTPGGIVIELLIAIAGLAMLVIGAPLLLEGATAVARFLGVSELVIGLTMIAVGTSLPELATAAVAAKRGKTAIVLGNVIGSNIFNVFLVLGFTSVIFPINISAVALHQDIPVMIGFSILLPILCFTGRILSRGEGIALMVLYFGYTAWLFVR